MRRFWDKVEKGPGCWEWTGARNEDGYGLFWFHGKSRGAHRVSFLFSIGAYPTGLACHRCDNPSCVRPSHIFDGGHIENKADSIRKGRSANLLADRNRNVTECPQGHAYAGLNVRFRKNGGRWCRKCAADWTRKRRLNKEVPSARI